MLCSHSRMFSERTNWKTSTNKYTQALETVRRSGEPLIDLTVSNPTECGLAYDSATILRAFQDASALRYEPDAKGLVMAREEVARYYREDHGEEVDVESLILTSSTSEAYSHIFRLLCNAQDEILVPKPSYPLFDFLADLQDVRLVPYELQYAHGWFVDFASVMRAVTPRTRAILLVHPNNPTGSYVKEEELSRLNELCQEHELALIVDEVFLDYTLDGAKRKSFVANGDALTFTLSGLSKIAALPQMKVAWLATTGPESLVKEALARLEIIADTYLSLSSPTQWAFAELLEQRRSLQPQLMKRIRENWAALRKMAGDSSYCRLLETEGGWYAVLQVRAAENDEGLAIELMREAHVLVHPGHFYDFSGDGYLVLSLITEGEQFRKGTAKLLGQIEQRRVKGLQL